LVFILGLIATLGTVLSLAAIGGGAEIVRRNALGELRWGGGLVLAAVLLGAVTAVAEGLQSKRLLRKEDLFSRRALLIIFSRKGLLIIAAVIGVLGLAVVGYGVTKRSRGRPAVSVTFTRRPTPSLLIIVKAGGLSQNNDLNLTAFAFPNSSGNGTLREPLIQASFGPDPSGDASIQARVPVQVSNGYKSVVIRAWVGSFGRPGLCFFERVAPSTQSRTSTQPQTSTLPRTGCVIFPLVPTPIKGCVGRQSGGPCGTLTHGPKKH